MIAACSILAASTFLVTRRAHPKISNELLNVLADPSKISEYDLCDYVVEGLREAAAKLRDDLLHDPSQLVLQGCLLVPQVRQEIPVHLLARICDFYQLVYDFICFS